MYSMVLPLTTLNIHQGTPKVLQTSEDNNNGKEICKDWYSDSYKVLAKRYNTIVVCKHCIVLPFTSNIEDHLVLQSKKAVFLLC
jgi:hypothetical protein